MIPRETLERWKALADALPAWWRNDDGGLVSPPQEFGPPLSDEELCEMFEIGTVTAFAREAVPALIAEVEAQAKENEELREHLASIASAALQLLNGFPGAAEKVTQAVAAAGITLEGT